MEKGRVVIADEIEAERKRIAEIISAQCDLDVVGLAENGEEACELVRSVRPNVLVVNQIMPVLDGMGVLERLATVGERKDRPYVIMVSEIRSEWVIKEAFRKGAFYYYVKPVCTEALIGCIRAGVRWREEYGEWKPGFAKSGEAFRKWIAEQRMQDIFHKIGIPAHLDGSHYLGDAVLLLLSQNGGRISFTKTIYPAVADKYGISADKVERCMRKAVDIGWLRGSAIEINRLFGYTISPERGKPTNSEFISTIAEKLRVEMM